METFKFKNLIIIFSYKGIIFISPDKIRGYKLDGSIAFVLGVI